MEKHILPAVNSMFNRTTLDIIIRESTERIILFDQDLQVLFMNKSAEFLLQKLGSIGVDILKALDEHLFINYKQLKNDVKQNESRSWSIYSSSLRQSYLLTMYPSDVGGCLMIKDVVTPDQVNQLTDLSSGAHGDKLSLIGRLAAGIAHEIRNPLTTIKGFVKILSDQQQVIPGYFDIIQEELKNIEFFISKFSILSNPHMLSYSYANIVELVEETLAISHKLGAEKQIVTTLDYDEEIPHIKCAEQQLKQAFLNICRNAIEAMPNGGKITTEIRNMNNGYIRISITDTGVGMSAERIERLAEPFYTTKEKGIGLGLMIAYRTIEMHQGRVTINSETGKGTQVNIDLKIHKRFPRKKAGEQGE